MTEMYRFEIGSITARADGARMAGAHEMAERHTRAVRALIQAAHAVRDTEDKA